MPSRNELREKIDQSNDNISQRVLMLLNKHRVLSTMELCREVNGFSKGNYQICHKNMKFGAVRRWNALCKAKENCCMIPYLTLYRASNGILDRLVKRGTIQTEKRRFWDKGKALPTDTFRFWFIERKDYEQLILAQTLDLYVRGGE